MVRIRLGSTLATGLVSAVKLTVSLYVTLLHHALTLQYVWPTLQ